MTDDVQDDVQEQERDPRRTGILEALVGLSIVVSVAGVVMPIVGSEIAGSRETRALHDMQDIVDGLRDYSNSTLFLPTGIEGRTNVAWLYGPGEVPASNTFAAGGDGWALEGVLLDGSMAGDKWQGPYIDSLHPDPWGNAYVLNVEGLLTEREAAMALSAGPDGVVDTAPTDQRARGDDIVLPIN